MADIYVSTTGNDTTGTGSSGNPYATPGKAASVMVAGDRMLVKAGTYNIDLTATANTSGGRVALALNEGSTTTRIEGYQTTVGDLGTRPVFLVTVGSAGVYVVASTGNHMQIDNIEVDCNGNAGNGINGSSQNGRVFHCIVRRATGVGITIGGVTVGEECFVTGCSGTAGIATAGGLISKCEARANSTTGIALSSDGAKAVRCISASNTGASSMGISNGSGGSIEDCTVYGNGSHGIGGGATSRQLYIANTLSYGNGGEGFNSGGTYPGCRLRNCAGGGNASGNYNTSNITAVTGFIALAGNPFTNAAAGDFSLNNTAGAGAACRAAGVPGAFPGGTTTGYLSIGAAQEQSTGGGGSTFFSRGILTGGRL